MAIITLIAAGRLDDRMVVRARQALDGVAVRTGALEWIDEGDAADLPIEGSPGAARDALRDIDHLDFAVRAGERVAARLFVADMDSTMIGQECIDELADYAGFKDKVAAVTERAMRGEIDFASALEERVSLLGGVEDEVLSHCLRSRIRPSRGAATLVGTLKARGVVTALVSGGFTAFVEPIAKQLGFDTMLANRLAVSSGRLTGSTEGTIVDGHAKRAFAEAILAEIGAAPEEMVAIGDGANDAPMIERAGLGIGYRPKPALAAVADGLIRHHDLTALLWMQGIPKREWAVAPD